MEFVSSRIVDVDEDGFPEYGDRFTGAPYLYVATETGRFRDADLAVYETGDQRNISGAYEFSRRKGAFQIISAGRDGNYGAGGDLKMIDGGEDDNIVKCF